MLLPRLTNFVLSEHEPDSPVMFENLSPSACFGTKMADVPCNLISPRITAVYGSLTPPSDMEGKKYELPRYADISKEVLVYINGKEIDHSLFRFTESRVTVFNSAGIDSSSTVSISYYVKNPQEIGFEDVLYDCKLAVAFGGNTRGGTRIFFTGNKNKKGYYFRSEVLNPLFVSSKDVEIIGDGCENVTAVVKMYGNLIIFTEKSVFRMSFNLSSDSVYYSVKEVSCEAGCDCPDSVQLIDNRVVFANSEKGIFIIDSMDDNGEHNIKPISANIFKGKGIGFADRSVIERQNSKSADFDRKYMLFTGGFVYILDYDKCSYYDSGSYSKAQDRLCWYIYKDISADYVFENSSDIFTFSKDERDFCRLSKSGTSEQVEFCVTGCETEFDASVVPKYVTQMEFMLSSMENVNVQLCLYADGTKYFEKNLCCNNGKKTRFSLSLPRKQLYSFYFEIKGKGHAELESVIMKYINV